ncbi:MAG: hypothetical protein K0S60_197 [Evtepia sp.]|jgi:hypothetical protein|nr:hypothetical protein [Evtepia sp.]
MPVQGILTKGEIPRELLSPNENVVRFIVPQSEVRGYIWYSSPSDVKGFIDYANVVMSEMFPNDGEAYMEAGFALACHTVMYPCSFPNHIDYHKMCRLSASQSEYH